MQISQDLKFPGTILRYTFDHSKLVEALLFETFRVQGLGFIEFRV